VQKINLTQEQIDYINSSNLFFREAKEYLKVSKTTMWVLVKNYNLKLNKDHRKYKPNDNYFKIWSNEMAYFLGLIAADGHIRKQNSLLTISLQEKDKQVVENLRLALNYDGFLYKMNKKDGQPQFCLSVTSKEIINDLINLGLSGNKTFDLDWINGMDEQYISHFVRGVFDGDGCIHINEGKGNFIATIVGTYKLTENIKTKYNEISKVKSGHLAKKGKVQCLVFNGKYNALEFLDWIYTNSTPETRLERKHDLYLELKEFCKEDQTPNNSIINQSIANTIRDIHQSGNTVKAISDELNLSEHIVHDVVQNRTWSDSNYTLKRKKQDTILITYNNQSKSIKGWSVETGLPYSTIDRRYREFQAGKISLDQVFHNDEKRLNLGKTQSERDIRAYELAKNLRADYKNGLIGKALYEKYNIPKSRAMDLIANRTCKEEIVWWKNN